MTLVFTTKGMVPREKLEMRDIVTEDERGRMLATEYYLDGELVRRSIWYDLWKPLEIGTGVGANG